jgi:aspartate aminotransferase-like enzyme
VNGEGGRIGFRYLPCPGRRSWTVSCLRMPDGTPARPLVQRLRADGWVIGSGYGPLKDSTIRIGHMGDHTVAGVGALLDRIEQACR